MMSHFSTAVFTDSSSNNVEYLLAPYDENCIMSLHIEETKEEAIKRIRKEIKDCEIGPYAEWKKNPKKYEAEHNAEHIQWLRNKFPKMLNYSDNDCYKEAIKYLKPEELDSDGNILSTCNSNAKWDWYSIGGRWDNSIITKNGRLCNSAPVREIDFDLMEKTARKNLIPFTESFERKFYNKKYFSLKYPNEEAYIQQNTTFSTYAVIMPNGKWYEPGQMGFWGLSSATPAQEKEFIENYKDKFIIPAIKRDLILTIVDCHI